MAACKAAGALVACEQPQTIADGLRAPLGSLTWPIVRDLVDDVVTVSEREIVAAMRLCFERMKVDATLRLAPLQCINLSFYLQFSCPCMCRQVIVQVLRAFHDCCSW